MLSLADAPLPQGEVLVFQGGRLVADCPDADACPDRSAPFWPERAYAACQEENCERTPLTVPDGPPVRLQFIATWEVQDDDFRNAPEYIGAEHLALEVGIGPPGASREDVTWADRGKYGAVGSVELAPGTYELVAVAQYGEGSYQVSLVELGGQQGLGTGELLPDLVVGPPRQVRIETPLGREANPALTAGGSNGCGADEVADEEARRCLRFASDIGNVGHGILELILPKQEATLARAGGSVDWVQRIHHADGTVREEEVSQAEYHPTHGHYHIAAFAHTYLYAYDQATGTRGELVADGGKTGFCVVDGGPLTTARPGLAGPVFDGRGCCYYAVFCEMDTVFVDDFYMGLSAGWFDIYPWWRSGQYVDITGIPDGVYELVTMANPDLLVIEAEGENNAGGVVLELTGNAVEILSGWTQAPVEAARFHGS
ncbi:MAG: lysyl oxidase family protein [Candidatus Thermoplasmatota archaeon]|nr:lysyl oxidase family protein [Candidatus Thermoplasmatota archaeon]